MSKVPLLTISATVNTAALAIYAGDTFWVVSPMLSAAASSATGVHTDYIIVLTNPQAAWLIWAPFTLLGLGVLMQLFVTFGTGRNMSENAA